jgi:hypothetical protein
MPFRLGTLARLLGEGQIVLVALRVLFVIFLAEAQSTLRKSRQLLDKAVDVLD